jgi:hypothetical protein
MSSTVAFNLLATTIDEMHYVDKSGQLTPRQLVQMYLARIETYDKTGPTTSGCGPRLVW